MTVDSWLLICRKIVGSPFFITSVTRIAVSNIVNSIFKGITTGSRSWTVRILFNTTTHCWLRSLKCRYDSFIGVQNMKVIYVAIHCASGTSGSTSNSNLITSLLSPCSNICMTMGFLSPNKVLKKGIILTKCHSVIFPLVSLEKYCWYPACIVIIKVT